MNTQDEVGCNADAMVAGQAQILRYIYGALDGMAIRCCVELRIADIIHNHGHPITLSEIANGIASPSINLDGLRRLMRFLVHRKIFQVGDGEGGNEDVYSLNHCSKWLLCDADVTLAPMVMMRTDPSMVLPLHVLSRSITEGGTAFKMIHGEEMFDFSSSNSGFNRVFNEGMACTAKITINAILASYKTGFLGTKGSVVDVGGGTGVAISEIVKAYPHLNGINFDLPHVISMAPRYDNGVTHIGGDMFEAIPPAETIFMKWILHDWSDDDCIKILKNCRKAIPKESGKIVIAEIVNHPTGDDPFVDTQLTYDLVMFSHFSGGRERNESEWKRILNEGGFRRYNIIKIPSLQSIIEAFPE